MNKELEQEYKNLESTIQAGNFSGEGLEFLIQQCQNAAKDELGGAAIAVYALTRNSGEYRVSCQSLYLWACEKYGKDLIDGSIQKYVDKVYLSNIFKQQF